MVPSGLMRIHSLCWYILVALLCEGSTGCVLVKRDSTNHASDSLRAELTRAMNLRIYGAGDELSPPILRIVEQGKPKVGMGSDALTLAFEMQSELPPNITLVLVHCDRNWMPTDNVFVQDQIHLRSSEFRIQRSPAGVVHYDYQAEITFPGEDNRMRIEHSGNYLARVVDYYNETHIYGEARFFAVESKSAINLDVASGFYESSETRVLQHGLKVRVEAQANYDIFGGQITAIDLYRSGEWYAPLTASGDSDFTTVNGLPWIRWYSSFGGKSVAEFGNLPAGNEHRLLDLTDIVYYPSTGGLVSTPLSDLPRNGFSQYDNNGVAVSRIISTSDADYVYFEFRLDLKGVSVNEDLFVVGSFNNWLPSAQWRMHYDKTTGFYLARGLLRRAVHEYQYVAGNWDEEQGILRHEESTLLEGNIRTSRQLFYAFIYYHEISSGGYDRIVGVATTSS